MNIAKKTIIYTFLALASVCILLVGFTPKENHIPQEVYQVYLDGDKIGLINSKEELENYIDKEQSAIKEKYDVENVYVPEGLEIKKLITYRDDISSAKAIYEKIKNLDSFTIKGYVITVKGDETQKIHVLDKEIFEKAIDKTIKAFINEDKYELYNKERQGKITTTGTIIEDISIGEDINIKADYIAADEKIYTSAEELTKYLLYGTTKTQETYTIKDNEIIEDVAFNHKLSVEEFLVANPEFSSEDVLLLKGQVVNIGLINPQVDIVETTYAIKDETKKFTVEIAYDSSMSAGITYVRQKGTNGLNRVTQRITQTNGEITGVEILGTEELKPSINEVIVRGEKYVPNVGISGYWYWPTISPYQITSRFGYRWGRLHAGIDISGCGYNSPIYAANNGTVEFASYANNGYGRYILINHNNGYYTQYAHLASIKVKVGQNVSRGQVIGGMGNSGSVVGRTGIHLHFGLWYGGAPHNGGVAVNPLKYY